MTKEIANKLIKKADNGDMDAWSELDVEITSGHFVELDVYTRLNILNCLAKSDDWNALYCLAEIYGNKAEIVCDYKKAIEYLKRASFVGDPWSMYGLGLMYDNGHGVKVSKYKAAYWYKKSTESAYSASNMFFLDLKPKEGMLVLDKMTFNRIYKQAIHGNKGYMMFLGNRYLEGKGVEVNEIEGVKWLERADDYCNYSPIINLAIAYYNGINVTQDYSKAYEYYKYIIKNGDDQQAGYAANNIVVDYVVYNNKMRSSFKENLSYLKKYPRYIDFYDEARLISARREVT